VKKIEDNIREVQRREYTRIEEQTREGNRR